MFRLNKNEIDFLDTSFKEGGEEYDFYVEFSEEVQKDLESPMSTDDFIQYMETFTKEVQSLKNDLPQRKIPYQFFCYLHHAPVLMRKKYFDNLIAKAVHTNNDEEYMSYYWTEFRVNKKFNGPEVGLIFDFRKELNYIRSYQSACRRFIKDALEDSAPYITALCEDIVRVMTNAYKPFYDKVDYNFDNLHDGYMSREELQSAYSTPNFNDLAEAWVDEHPVLTDIATGLAVSATLSKFLK